jgi:N-acetylmuramoyl-L-alanine amidase
MMKVDYSKAIPMFVDRNRVFINANPDSAIVIHKTAGFKTIEELGNYFASTDLMTSSHYGVGLDGRVAQFVLESDGAAANCCLENNHDPYWDQFGDTNLNRVTISIEHIDTSDDNSSTPTTAQLRASFDLVRDIVARTGITTIKTHSSLMPENRKNCPGNYPMDKLQDWVKRSLATKTILLKNLSDQGWTDDGTTLYAPDKLFPVDGVMRQFILDPANSWNEHSWPLTAKQWLGMVEESNQNIGSGEVQLFTYDRLCYRADKKVVYRSYIGKELLWWMNKH